LELCGENNFQVINGIGISLTKLRRYEDALVCFDKISKGTKVPPEVYCNKGIAYNALKQHSNALASYQKAIAIDPNYAQAWYNQGAALNDLGRYDEALASYDRAIEIYPTYAQAWSNKGVTFSCLGNQQKALDFFQKSLSIDSNYADAGWNLSLINLLLGNFSDGWKTHECRWTKEDPCPYLHSDRPQLNSLDGIAGKRILVWAEQGYGDTIHFCRLAPLLADLGATVVLEVQPPLVELINSLRDCHVIPRGQEASNIDYQIPLLSLPALLGTDLNSIPATAPYLRVSDAKVSQWKQRLQLSSSQLNVGIACSGNVHHQNDVNRSMPLSAFTPLLADKRLNLFLVQKDLRKEDSVFYEQAGNIQFLGASIGDFEDSAAIVQNLDIIISVDTSLVHLAGALGKEVLVLLPWVAEWRWLMDRKDSPWYPTATLIRQPNPGNWNAVIEAVGQLLNKKDLGV
jgi:tetratricopeptide (TPR) repeat protein